MDEHKRAAAMAALEELPAEGVLGLGTGSTAKHFIDAVGELVRQGRRYRCVATSEASRRQASGLGIELLPDEGPWSIDVTVDGADEISAALDLVKGGGGALLREKIVNFASARNVIVADESKLSKRLGEKFAIPVEVIAFAHLSTARRMAKLGEPVLRMKGQTPFRTDSNNLVYDLGVDPMDEPASIDRGLKDIPGVVETGLFLGRADVVIVAGPSGIRRLTP